MQLKWIWPIAALVFSILSPIKLGGLKFIPIYEALVVRAQKTSPPHIAFDEVNNFAGNEELQNKFLSDEIPVMELVAGGGSSQALLPSKIKAQKIILAEMVITKKPELIQAYAQHEEWKKDFTEGLSNQQKRIIAQAQLSTEVLDQDWSVPDWSSEVEKRLRESGYIQTGSRVIQAATPETSQKVLVTATDSQGETRQEVPQATAEIPLPGTHGFAEKTKHITGPLEITGGLAVTNEHYIEVRRINEGVAREIGRVDLQKGTYNISVEEPSGNIEAKLVDRGGKVLGEGSIRIARLDLNRSSVMGPKLKILPYESLHGLISDYYSSRAESSAPVRTLATLLKGAEEINVPKDGRLGMQKLARGSVTVLRAAAPKYMQTASLVTSGQEFNVSMFPTSMMKALKEIVNSEKITASSDSSIEAELGAVIWGRATQDGKTISGIQVQIESQEGLAPIYFNQFMLPDPSLSATSENGLYAFIDVNEGFHSLVANRGDSYFGYQNAVVENGSVALADVENSIKSESVPLRVFDAFSGEPLAGNISLQGLAHEVEVTDGSSVLLLPQVSRVGLVRVTPASNDYLAARYMYNDKDSYIHLPMVPWSWLSNVKSFLKINDAAESGIVVGFVPDENFEVYLAGHDNFDSLNIVYFDMQGKILQTKTGIAGGGFIMYNVPVDTHEIVVLGTKTQKIYSKVLPVDVNSLSVLSFRE